MSTHTIGIWSWADILVFCPQTRFPGRSSFPVGGCRRLYSNGWTMGSAYLECKLQISRLANRCLEPHGELISIENCPVPPQSLFFGGVTTADCVGDFFVHGGWVVSALPVWGPERQ